MKKHKVKIPNGYEIENTITGDDWNPSGSHRISTEIIFKPIKKQFPKTWGEYMISEGDWLETKPWEIMMPAKYIESVMALIKLIQLRDYYNDGWKPDWYDDSLKHIIVIHMNAAIIEKGREYPKILVFKTEDLRDKFFLNFRELIETAKPLL